MTTLQERIASERRRLRLVRMKMLAAIEKQAQGVNVIKGLIGIKVTGNTPVTL